MYWLNIFPFLGQQGYNEGYDQSNDGGEEPFDPMAFYRQQQQEMMLQATQHVQVCEKNKWWFQSRGVTLCLILKASQQEIAEAQRRAQEAEAEQENETRGRRGRSAAAAAKAALSMMVE